MGSQRQYLELLVSFRLSLRRTAVFIRFYLFIPKRDDVEELRTSDKLLLRWCFSVMRISLGDKELLFL